MIAGAGRHRSRDARRWTIAGLLGLGVIVNYCDRALLAATAPAMQQALRVDDLALGVLLSAFGWTYGLCQVPAGLLLDRFGVRYVMLVSISLWAAATLLAGLATGVVMLFVARAMLGMAEAPTFPANAKAVGRWFGREERGLATACFDGAAKLANIVALPMIAFVTVSLGWQSAFYAMAAASAGYWLLFFRTYRAPAGMPDGPGDVQAAPSQASNSPESVSSARLLRNLLRQREVWALSLSFGSYSYAFAFFMAWMPTYLSRTSGAGLLESSSMATIPWVCAAATNLIVGGWLVDRLVKAGVDGTRVRKTVITLGMLAGLAIAGVAFTSSHYWALVWLSLSLSGLSAASPAFWAMPALIASRGAVGTVSGLMNFTGSLLGILSSMLTGFVVWYWQSFYAAFLVAGLVVGTGILCLLFLLGEVAPANEPPHHDLTAI